MRVLFLEKHAIWINGLPIGFKDAGHEVLCSGVDNEDTVAELINNWKPDFIMMMGWTEQHCGIKRKWIRKCINSVNIPLIYWATEDPIHHELLTVPFIRQICPEFVFTVSKKLVPTYEAMGFNSAYLDFGFHPSVHKCVEKVDGYTCRIAVVANAYPGVIKVYPEFFRFESLRTLITPLLEDGLRIDFWGTRWEEMDKILGVEIPRDYIHGYLPYEEAHKVYSSADIVIGLQNTLGQVTMRTFEILGSGGFLLTSDTPAVSDLFEIGRHLEASTSPKKTLELVRYYLDNPEERQKIRKNGQLAVAPHNYRARAGSIISVLKARKIL